MTRAVPIAALIVPLALAACAVAPTGPSVIALPKQGEDFGRFQAADINCRNFAAAQIGFAGPNQAATDNAVGSAVLETAVGAAAGAAIGAAAGNPGAGAAIGAASGLAVGSAAGASSAYASSATLQWRYDVAYTQCMVANGYSVQQPAYVTPYYGPAGYYPEPYFPYYYGLGMGWGAGWYGGYRSGWYGGGWHGGGGGWYGGGGGPPPGGGGGPPHGGGGGGPHGGTWH